MPADRPPEETLPAGAPPPRGESETLLAGARPSAMARTLQPPERPDRARLLERLTESRSRPFLRLTLYYLFLAAAMALLAFYVPMVRSAFLSPVTLPLQEGGALAGPAGDFGARLSLEEALERAGVTLLVIAGALTLVVPVAWVYMLTKRYRYDPALVSSVIILPIVVSGIAMVVKNSIALAFALAGIVAAVRFRNTLKDPRDAVYIFLVIGIGLSSGVQALDVALVMSFAFNAVVLLVWRHNVGTIYSGRYARTGILSVGSAELLLAQEPEAQRAVRRRMLDPAREIASDGILLVHSRHPSLARTTVQEALADLARDWRLVDAVDREQELVTLEYVVRLKKSAAPADLVGSLDERWGRQVAAAEYVPFRTRSTKRKKTKPKKKG